MTREANLFEESNGSPVEGFFRLMKSGTNVPPAWIERSSESRRKRQKALGEALQAHSLDALELLRDWEIAYRKECFYYGLRVLLELHRSGKTKY